ncbi:MAG TPA: acetamidase/formamidase family protein [Gaiellaceae bacterium]|nr:acetamidase/formamidase family protein [Gaiellaceae bacterium]
MKPVDPKGFFSRDYAPAVTVDPGEPVVFSALNAGWYWEPEIREPAPEGAGHALFGPIEVRGAQAGGTLVVHVDEVSPRGWGVTHAPDVKLMWSLEGRTWVSERGSRVAAAPFLGVIGMPPPEPGEHSTGPPRRWGGNIDCKLLVAGTRLYLPVPVDGGLLLAGDGHGAQGDGEVSGTAIECPVERARLRLEPSELELRSPIARVDGAWVTFGFHEDLDAAADEALQTMLDLMKRDLGVDRNHATALASVTVDLSVTQVVNGAKGVHAVLRDDAIR